jgi:hypothetical protein
MRRSRMVSGARILVRFTPRIGVSVGHKATVRESRTVKRGELRAPKSPPHSPGLAKSSVSRHFLILLFVVWAASAFAHNPETSYARVEITPRLVAFKFTYDVTTLQRVTKLDADGNGQITRAEFETGSPAIERFLRAHLFLDFNQREAEFGPADPPTWPADAGEAIPESDYGQRLLSFTFRNPVLSAPEDVALTFDFFGELGERHNVLGVFMWNGHEDDVIFTRFEPDYLYDRLSRAAEHQPRSRACKTHLSRIRSHRLPARAAFVKRFWTCRVITAFTVAHTLTLAGGSANREAPPQLIGRHRATIIRGRWKPVGDNTPSLDAHVRLRPRAYFGFANAARTRPAVGRIGAVARVVQPWCRGRPDRDRGRAVADVLGSTGRLVAAIQDRADSDLPLWNAWFGTRFPREVHAAWPACMQPSNSN